MKRFLRQLLCDHLYDLEESRDAIMIDGKELYPAVFVYVCEKCDKIKILK